MAKICCRRIIGEKRCFRSPFTRLLATGYYDGPTDGLVECGVCQTVYTFHKIDWDDGQDVRIFVLAPVLAAFDEIEHACSIQPKWPIWVLMDNTSPEASDIVARLLATASHPEFVVAARDLLGTIKVWRATGLPEVADWFAELGCSRVTADPE